MRNDPANLRTRLERASDAFGLSKESRDLTLSQVFGSQQSPDDPTVVVAVTANYARQVTLPLIEAVDALPAKIEETSRKAVGQVAKAATARVEEAHARLTENVGHAVGQVAADHLDRAEKRREVRLGANLIGIALALVVVAGFVGWRIGKADTTGLTAEWAALVQRSDSQAWASMIAANPDLGSSIRNNCGPGAPRARVVNGARVCEIPLWLEGSSAPAATGPVAGVYAGLLDWLAGWGPLWLVGGGLLAGLLGRKLLRAFVSWKPIAWLVD